MRRIQRPYIIINGVNSREIEGLIITNSPTITKPLMRTQTEEIDGRDGSIITKLGYSAYDKKISIGLSYNYNIDEIIKYFNQSGIITFSNEPDKYYIFEQIDQIDFERLVRFKTAEISFRVQPFKYKIGEIVESDTTLTVDNLGNVDSKPELTIGGNGNLTVIIDGNPVIRCVDVLGNIKLSGHDLNAYRTHRGVVELANRNVIGDLNDLKLTTGRHTITVLGNYSSLKLENFSRWI